ncbi:putative F-box protein At3g16210 [Syzygium oleosum]|uniref:putative F-box protein At3g16210 n=1 Tax=Syzygium oleosum TaxID=219896 RepID=UPI0011D202EC|nr:putative F-box protein At3g16210 [Syzygium oleosum]
MSTTEWLSGILPSDVMVKILACLPARSLVRFRCVSKLWRSLFSEPYFVAMRMKCSGTTLLVVPLQWGNREQCSLVFENVSIGMKNLKLPFGNRWFSLSMVGLSSDGALICLTGLLYARHRESKQAIILWSLFMGEIKVLGNEGGVQSRRWPVCTKSLVQGYNSACCNQYLVHGFKYEPNAQDYKVGRITYLHGDAREAYSLIRPWHAFVNGSAHWLAAPAAAVPNDSIVAFNMKEESFGEVIELPQSANLSQFSLNPRGKATLSVSCSSLTLIAFGEWN